MKSETPRHFRTDFLALAMAILVSTALPTGSAFSSEPSISDRDNASGFVTVRDIFDLETAENPQVSPDGRFLAYERHRNDVMTDQRFINIWIVDVGTASETSLLSGSHHDRSPIWSPNGKHLAFISNRDGTAQIHIHDPEKGRTRKLTSLPYPPQHVRWSPNSRLLSFVSFVPGDRLQIASMPKPPDGAVWAEPPRLFDQLRYRWDQLGYLNRGMLQVFVVSVDDGEVRQVSDDDFPNGGVLMNDSPQPLTGPATPEWSPDGHYLYLSTVRQRNYELNAYDTEIYRLSLKDGSMLQLTDRRGPDAHAKPSPDGKKIAYLGYDDSHKGYQVVQLYLMNSNGGEQKSLTTMLDRDVSDISWSKNGNLIYFQYVDHAETKLARVSLDGKMEVLARNLGSRPSAYPSGDYSVADNGEFAYTTITAERFGRIAIGPNAEASKHTLLVDVNSKVFSEKHAAKVEAISYKSSRDGRTIHGWIVLPPSFDKTKKYPLVLEVHGGPFANYGARFDYRMQTMAARGFIVLYTNPRGSTSYGEDFGNLIHHAYPSNDYYDLQDGIDMVISLGYVDTENLFYTGGSGGGILGAWTIGKTSRFRAASILYPAVNFVSWTLTSDKARKLSQYFFPQSPWNAMEHYDKRSPLSLVGDVITPTLIQTGENDFRTPISESEQLYTALKLQGIEAVMVRYPGEGHGIGKRPSNKISTVEHTIAWFEKYKTK